jgi:hypothetical protein
MGRRGRSHTSVGGQPPYPSLRWKRPGDRSAAGSRACARAGMSHWVVLTARNTRDQGRQVHPVGPHRKNRLGWRRDLWLPWRRACVRSRGMSPWVVLTARNTRDQGRQVHPVGPHRRCRPHGQNRFEQNDRVGSGRVAALTASISATFLGEHPAFTSMVAAADARRGQNRFEQNDCVGSGRMARRASQRGASLAPHVRPLARECPPGWSSRHGTRATKGARSTQ